jgi:hypothetical protein
LIESHLRGETSEPVLLDRLQQLHSKASLAAGTVSRPRS